MTFEDQGLTTPRARQPLTSMRIFIAMDRIEPCDPSKCNGTVLGCILCVWTNLDTDMMSPWLVRLFAIAHGRHS